MGPLLGRYYEVLPVQVILSHHAFLMLSGFSHLRSRLPKTASFLQPPAIEFVGIVKKPKKK